MVRSAAALLLFGSAGVVTVGCKGLDLDDLLGPKEGGRCEKDTAKCIDHKSQLWCVNGKFVKRSCSGPSGCKTNDNANTVMCDWELDLAGTRCAASEENEAGCTADRKAMVRCSLGELRPVGCEGPSGCTELANGKISCDGSVGAIGGSCGFDGPACDKDGKTSLLCKGEKLVKDADCRGPGGCKAFMEGDSWRVECDRSLATVGDTCPGDGAACSVDRKAFLECKDGRFVATLNCLGKNACHEKGASVFCDASVGNVGDTCSDPSGSACSVDGKAILQCKNEKLVLERKCKCTVAGDLFNARRPRRSYRFDKENRCGPREPELNAVRSLAKVHAVPESFRSLLSPTRSL